MKIKRLELKAFGPFTGRSLDFSSEWPGLHVVYGPNEAGKSSALRALQAWLFGFPPRTRDNFQYSYEQLLVGGCLEAGDGRELSFSRRKKSKNSLFDQQDQPLDPAVLTPFLHGLQQDQFTALHGINHETLVAGGQGILAQQGEVGQALFAAGSGLASLKAIEDELEAEASSLFRPKGTNQAISTALAQYKELQVQLRQVTLAGRDWQEHQRALAEAEARLADAQARRDRLNREKRHLERLQRALPYLGERRSLLENLAALGEIVDLPAGFGELRRQLAQRCREIRIRLDSAQSRVGFLEGKCAGISMSHAVLDHAEVIEELHQGLGQYRKNTLDRPQLEGRRIGCRTEAANLLRQIRPGDALEAVEALRPSLVKRKSIQALGARFEAIAQGLRQAERLLQATGKELEQCRGALGQLGPATEVGRLARLVVAARKSGDLDGAVAARRQKSVEARTGCLAALSRLGLWRGPLEQIAQLALPLPETVQRFEEEGRARDEEQQRLAIERGQLTGELAQLGEQVREIVYAGEVPSEEELGGYRHRRDQGWQLLRRQWLGGEDVAAASRDYDPRQPLPEAYERLVGLADQTADRLYREAERVQKHAALKAREAGMTRRLTELEARARRAEAAGEESAGRWRELWAPCGIEPLPPREMQAWLNGFDRLRFQTAEANKLAGEVAEQEARRRETRAGLLTELGAGAGPADFPGEELAPVLLVAEALVQRAQEAEARREHLLGRGRDLELALAAAQRERDEAAVEQRQWQARWDEAVAPLGLGGNFLPAEALDFLDTLQGCCDKLQEAEVFRKRIDGMTRDDRAFEEKILALSQTIAPELSKLAAPEAVAQLKARLGQASQEQAVFRQAAEEIATLGQGIVELGLELADCEAQIDAQHRLAGCEGEERLNELERRSCESLKLRDKLAETEVALARIAEGIGLAELAGQAQGLDPDALPSRIETLANEIEGTLDPEIRQLSEVIGREKNELARMDGSGKAAELADASQQVLAKIRRLCERYIRVKLASRMLREEIERYRSENQDPVLAIAGRYFQALTLGSLTGLRTDLDEQGQPVLVGVRPNGDWLPVAGMSAGTRDQLYLSLRLASLEWRLHSGEALPFIVDDILINFDDQRSRATLAALAKLAEKTQVILFTHQSQIFAAAQAMQTAGRILVHQL